MSVSKTLGRLVIAMGSNNMMFDSTSLHQGHTKFSGSLLNFEFKLVCGRVVRSLLRRSDTLRFDGEDSAAHELRKRVHHRLQHPTGSLGESGQ